MDETLSHRRIEAVFRIEWARLVAGLARFVRGDLGAAEELAQDALVAALETWAHELVNRRWSEWQYWPGVWPVQREPRREPKHSQPVGEHLPPART